MPSPLSWSVWSSELQWGRDLSIAEISVHSAETAGPFPLQWGRDLSIAEIAHRCLLISREACLQWGRDLSIAEMKRSWQFVHYTDASLQWGRDLSIAEISTAYFAIIASLVSSMGPRSLDRGNC